MGYKQWKVLMPERRGSSSGYRNVMLSSLKLSNPSSFFKTLFREMFFFHDLICCLYCILLLNYFSYTLSKWSSLIVIYLNSYIFYYTEITIKLYSICRTTRSGSCPLHLVELKINSPLSYPPIPLDTVTILGIEYNPYPNSEDFFFSFFVPLTLISFSHCSPVLGDLDSFFWICTLTGYF